MLPRRTPQRASAAKARAALRSAARASEENEHVNETASESSGDETVNEPKEVKEQQPRSRPLKRARNAKSQAVTTVVGNEAVFKTPEEIEAEIRRLAGIAFRKLNRECISNVYSFFDAVGSSIGSRLCRMTRKYHTQRVTVLAATKKLREYDLETKDKDGNPKDANKELKMVIPLIARFTSIIHVDLQGVAALTDVGAKFMAEMPFAGRLITLNLTSTKVSDVGMAALAAVCTNLTQIRVSHCQTMTDVSLAAAARAMPKLRWVDMSASGAGDATMTALATNCPEMIFADFSWCPGGNVGLESIARLSSKLQSLRVPARATDDGVDAIASHRTNLYSIGLVRLQVTDDGLINLATKLSGYLRSIHVAHCELISDRGLEGMAAASPGLTAFNLRTPGMLVSDRGVGHVVRNCTRLRSLKLRSCTRITDLSMESIAVNLKMLHALELHTLNSISPRGLCAAFEHCTLMRRLTIVSCQHIGSREAEAIMKLVASRPAGKPDDIAPRAALLPPAADGAAVAPAPAADDGMVVLLE